MNEVSARCGCKFTFCANKGALIRWADGSRQNVWRNSANPRAENIWGRRHPPDIRAEDTARPSTPVAPEAEGSKHLKQKASTELPLDPEITATTSPEGTLAEDPSVQHGDELGPQLNAQTNLYLPLREDTHVDQSHGIDPRMLTGGDPNMTLTQDPQFEEDYEFRGEVGRTGEQNHFIVDDNRDYSSMNDDRFNELFDNWVSENLVDTDSTGADPPNDEVHMRGGGGDQEREVRGQQRRKKNKSSRWRRMLGFYNHPSNSDKVLVVEEPSEVDEPYIIEGRAAGGQSFASDQVPEIEILPSFSSEHHQVDGHPRSTTTQNDLSTGNNSPLGSIKSHLTHPKPSEAWPPGEEEEVDKLDQSIPGQRRLEPLKVWTKNGKPVRRYVERRTEAGSPSTGPASRQHESARTTHQVPGAAARHRHTQQEAPRGGNPLYRTGSLVRRRPLRHGELPVPQQQFRRQLRRRSRDSDFQGHDRIIPHLWLYRSRVAYMTGLASFLLVLVLLNSVSWPQLVLIFMIAFAAVWVMED